MPTTTDLNPLHYNQAEVKIGKLVTEKSTNLEIIYYPVNDVNNFKQLLLDKKMAYINIHKINGEIEIIEWSAHKFKNSSDIEKNLRSNYLRDWKDKGIFKAELSTNKDDFIQLSSSLNSSAIPKIEQELKLKQEFYDYLISISRTHKTAYGYKNAINKISKDYSQNINQNIDIYQIQEQGIINEIAQKYSTNGEYAIAGYKENGTWRNSIARYSEFFASRIE
jgi:hypothetical protein